MDEVECGNTINIQSLINDYYLKYKDDKFNLTKFKKFLSEKNCSLIDIYIQLTYALITILENLSQSFAKLNTENLKNEEEILNRILTIMSESNSSIESLEESDKIIYNNFNELYPLIFNILAKISNLVKKPIYINDENLNNLINKYNRHILKLFKIIYDKEPNSIEYSIEKTDFYNSLINETFSRTILYEIIKIIIKDDKGKELNATHKGSLILFRN